MCYYPFFYPLTVNSFKLKLHKRGDKIKIEWETCVCVWNQELISTSIILWFFFVYIHVRRQWFYRVVGRGINIRTTLKISYTWIFLCAHFLLYIIYFRRIIETRGTQKGTMKISWHTLKSVSTFRFISLASLTLFFFFQNSINYDNYNIFKKNI